MADNPIIYSGNDGDPIIVATDEVGGAQHQLVLVEWGLPDTATRVSLADPLPVQVQGTYTVAANAGFSLDTGVADPPVVGPAVLALVTNDNTFTTAGDGDWAPLFERPNGRLMVDVTDQNVNVFQAGYWSFNQGPNGSSSGTAFADGGQSTIDASISCTGVFVFTGDGDGTWQVEGTIDNATWFPIQVAAFDGTGAKLTLDSGDVGIGWYVPLAGCSNVRPNLSAMTTGSYGWKLQTSSAPSTI